MLIKFLASLNEPDDFMTKKKLKCLKIINLFSYAKQLKKS